MIPSQTTLITGGNENDRRDAALKLVTSLLGEQNPKYDFFLLNCPKINKDEDKKHVGIEKSRELTKFFKEKPLQHDCKVALILEAQLLTTEAQNALLKTLEEPPESAFIILTADKRSDLLPTVVSRCRLIRLDVKKNAPTKIPTPDLQHPTSELLDWIAENKELLENKEELLKTLDSWEAGLRDQLLVASDPRHLISDIYYLWKLRELLKNTNVNTRLAVEEFLLKL